ncbi:DinB superfamily protein [Bremerella volcania]|uniref:DinB superfamily protein n=1 Tax=Bremerella volcania TaxID=2527984 RepID=A0A518CEK9_9BACT|nr:DinB family protein [Bremerella volcania]QDU77665.1 DinB superfamily protein [Bremerella volcania]
MNAVTPILRLHEHRIWATHHLLEACRPLSDEQLHQPHEIGQGTLWRTLCHLYAAEYVWLAALQGTDDAVAPGDVAGKLPGNQEGEGAATSLTTLIERWQQLDQRWSDYLDALTPEDLEKTIYRISSSSYQGQRIGSQAMDVLLHVATHAHYTTAQAINMLRHCGLSDLPPSMLITLARSQAVA